MKKIAKQLLSLIGISILLIGCIEQAEDQSANNTSPSTTTPSPSTTAQLNWVAPTTRTDNSSISLSEIGGYKIYGGTNVTAMTLLKTIADSSVTSYTASNLSPATHYFAVTVYDTNGLESNYSMIVSKTIN